MPRSAEFRVAVHQAARQRRAAGLPIWEATVDLSAVFHDQDMTLEQRRDRIVATLRNSAWLRDNGDHDAVLEALDELATVTTQDEFNYWWDEIYDHADMDRIWIVT